MQVQMQVQALAWVSERGSAAASLGADLMSLWVSVTHSAPGWGWQRDWDAAWARLLVLAKHSDAGWV